MKMISCPTPSHRDSTPSCGVYDEGTTNIHWHCFGCGWHADGVQYLRDIEGMPFKDAVAEAVNRGWRIPEDASQPTRAAQPAPATMCAHAEPPAPNIGKRDYAREIWKATLPATGTLAEEYLQMRAIPRAPASARFHPSLHKPEAEAELPAIVYGITDTQGELIAVQAAWLNTDGTRHAKGVVKRTYGSLSGGSMKIGEPEDAVVVCEGPETAMSASIIFGLAAEAVMGAGNVKHWQAPNDDVLLVFGLDNDGIRDNAAALFADKCREMCATHRVIARTPNHGHADYNDVLMAWPNYRHTLPI